MRRQAMAMATALLLAGTAGVAMAQGVNSGTADVHTALWPSAKSPAAITDAAAKGDPCLAIAKYKGGISTKRISAAAADYCRRAKIVTGMM